MEKIPTSYNHNQELSVEQAGLCGSPLLAFDKHLDGARHGEVDQGMAVRSSITILMSIMGSLKYEQ